VHPSGRRTWGQTLLIDPWGKILAERAQEAGVVCAELDFQTLVQCRSQLPSLEHRVL
jgi:predicted amidohydrolase